MESTSSGRRVRFGQFDIDEKAGELRKDGTKIRLQEQPLQILQVLLEHPGEIVTREELRKRVWPTDTFVDFDHGINNAIKRLREALGDTAETPRYIETLPRRGYRFVQQIQSNEYRVRSLAVLPLENLSHDPEQEYFTDGMTDALNREPSQNQRLAGELANHRAGKRQPLPIIARELGVDAVIEGTVLRSGERVRISVQLIEAATDSHLTPIDPPCMLGLISDAYVTLQLVHCLRQAGSASGVEASATTGLDDSVAA